MATRLVRLQLLNGDPEGLRSANIAGRTTEVTGCPWIELPALLQQPEAKRPAVYFLVGLMPESDSTGDVAEAVYVGECDSLSERFSGKHHRAEDAEWSQIFVATAREDTFNKAHARLAEHLLTLRAHEAGRATVLTKQTSPGNLPEGDISFATEFVENVIVLAQVLGVSVFRPKPKLKANVTTEIPAIGAQGTQAEISEIVWEFAYTKQPVAARMIVDGSKFIVLKGSKARKRADAASSPFAYNQQNIAMKLGALVEEPGGELIFKDDFAARSISAAGAAVYGSNCQGPDAWYDPVTKLSYRERLKQPLENPDG